METRVALLEQAYDNMNKRLDSVETKLDALREDMHNSQKSMMRNTYIALGLFATITISAFGMIISAIT